jgi:hypothetical protein
MIIVIGSRELALEEVEGAVGKVSLMLWQYGAQARINTRTRYAVP